MNMIATEKSFGTELDYDLQRRVKNYLNSKQMRSLRDVVVDADNGTVVLRGEVNSFYEKQLCLSCTRRVAGVVELVDEILVREIAAASR
jgi:osmotically-inducible protein OsmY